MKTKYGGFGWFKEVFQVKGSVIGSIKERVILCALFALLIAVIEYKNPGFFSQEWTKTLTNLIPGITLVLGLLLVFRTNTAYDRFWEGRKLWGNISNTIRSMVVQILSNINATNPEIKEQKIVILKILVALAYSIKLHLRSEIKSKDHEFEDLLSPSRFNQIKNINHVPLQIAFWVNDDLQKLYSKKAIDQIQLNTIQESNNVIIHAIGGCERILRTPIPLAYSIHLKQLLLIYCFVFAFLSVSSLKIVTVLAVSVIAFVLFGIEEIGIEIENPFGHDPNDLPLDTLCEGLRNYVEEAIKNNA